MEKTRIDLPGVKEIVVKAESDLKVSGWEEAGALASCETNTLSVAIDHETAHIACDSELNLIIPSTIPLRIDSAGGDLIIKDIKGHVNSGVIGGDAKFANISGNVFITNIEGDARLLNIAGEVNVDSVGGDFSAVDLQSPIHIKSIGGDLSFKNCSKDATAKVGGDISILFSAAEERNVSMHAGGEIDLHFEGDPSGTFNTVAGSGTTEVQLLEERQLKGSSVNQFKLGSGVGSYKLVAGGDIHICNREACHSRRHTGLKDFKEFGFDQINIDLGDIPGIDTTELQQRINEKLEKLHAKTERIHEKIEEKMQKHQQKMQRHEDNHAVSGIRLQQKEMNNDPVSDDEKKLILKMLQEKKISPEEAERLFESLEEN